MCYSPLIRKACGKWGTAYIKFLLRKDRGIGNFNLINSEKQQNESLYSLQTPPSVKPKNMCFSLLFNLQYFSALSNL